MSNTNQSAFCGISLKSLSSILNLITPEPSIEVKYLDKRFSENSLFFKKNFDFLRTIKLIRKNSKGVSTQEEFTNYKTKSIIAMHLQYLHGFYKTEIRHFFYNSVFTDSGLEVVLDSQLVSYFAPLRNLLIELNVLFYGKAKRLYLNSTYKELIYNIQRPRAASSPKELLDISKKKLLFGLRVEQKIFQEELKRLRQQDKDKVVHVSLFDSEAGYDIKSIKQAVSGVYENSYLEVKAVNSRNWEFFWTKNEKQSSKFLGEAYCIVLVPCSKGAIDLKSRKDIWNPAKFFLNTKEWTSEVSAERFYLKQ